jgi:hypothetical protein
MPGASEEEGRRGRERKGTYVHEEDVGDDRGEEEGFGGATARGGGITTQGGVGDVVEGLEARESGRHEEGVPRHVDRLDRAGLHLTAVRERR